MEIVYLVIFSLVCVLGVLGNGVVIWVTGFKMKKTVNTVWYLNLAVADFLVTVFLPLGITTIALDYHWPFGKFMCKMAGTVFYLNSFASIIILVVISVDRCVCVGWPVWAQNHRSVRKASWRSLGVWVLGLALSSPYFIVYDTWPYEHDEDIIVCNQNFAPPSGYDGLEDNGSAAMKIYLFVIGYVVPFLVIITIYFVIFLFWLDNNRSLAGQSGRPLKIIATVVTAFFLCWAPFHIMELIGVHFLLTERSETLDHVLTIGSPIAYCLAFLNSCLNPLLYVFMGQDFKAVFRSSILKVLEKAFTEELPHTITITSPSHSTNPGRTTEEIPLSETQV